MAASHQEPSTMFAAVQRTLGLVLLTLACSAGAEVLETLYQDSVAVADQSRSGLSRAARQGLERVLVRVSGEREVSQQDGVRQALARADQLLDAYHYERNDPPPGEEGEEGEEALPWRVQLSFSESGVQRLLQEVGLPCGRPIARWCSPGWCWTGTASASWRGGSRMASGWSSGIEPPRSAG